MIATALPQRHVERCMGTVFSIDVRAPGVDSEAIRDVVDWLHQVDATFSTYRSDSAISRLARGDMKLDECPSMVAGVLERCAELEEETGGYFDCRAGGGLDPSGYVKGWAIECASDLLVRSGSANHCVNGGGDVQCVGRAAPDRDWHVGIADPDDPVSTIATICGRRLAVATSGPAERGAHIVDPHTGGAPVTDLASITVYGAHLADVDAYATAAFAMGERAEAWLAGKGLRAVLVDGDGTVRTR